MLLTLTVSAYDAEIDGIYYNFGTGNMEAEVTSGDTKYTGSVMIPATVQYDATTYDVTTIKGSAFYHCYELTEVTIPNSVTTIGNDAFCDCNHLTSLTIPNSVKSIGTRAFYSCTRITSITMGDGVTSIGDDAFSSCWNLTDISIPNSVTSIGDQAFAGTPWYKNQPDGLIYAGKVAYTYKGSMPAETHIELEEGTLGIADRAFYSCPDLTSITIPNSVSRIGILAFGNCSGLTSITIPESMEYISEEAFYGCSGLQEMFCLAKQVPTTGPNIFWNSSIASAILYVPASALDTYKSTYPWNKFGTILPIAEPTYIVGDANGNGEVEIGDVTSVLTLMATPEATGYDNKAADANGNGGIEIGDVTTILTIMANGGQ